MSDGSFGRRMGAVAAAVGKTLAIALPTMVEGARGTVDAERIDARLDDWSRTILDTAGVELVVEDVAALEPGRAYVIMSNHESHYDVPILFQALRRRLRMVAKAELFKIPIFGPALGAAGFIRVERSGRREDAARAMSRAARMIADGTSVWIAPEGTRADPTDTTLRAFKKGGFRLAHDAGVPIAPVAILGSRHVLPKHGRLTHCDQRVTVRVGRPIPVDHHPIETLMAQTREALLTLLR